MAGGEAPGEWGCRKCLLREKKVVGHVGPRKGLFIYKIGWRARPHGGTEYKHLVVVAFATAIVHVGLLNPGTSTSLRGKREGGVRGVKSFGRTSGQRGDGD